MLQFHNCLWPIALALAEQSVAITLPEKKFEILERDSLFPRDAFDVSTYASLGDSFASGPSAGEKYDTTRCRRYTEAFGPRLAKDDRLQGSKQPKDFSFIACSGSKLRAIYIDRPDANNKPKESQAKQLANKNPEMVTMSIGGNDIGFSKLLDKCVYRFYQSSIDGCRGCSWWHFDDCSKECDTSINEINNDMNSGGFANAYNDAIKEVFKYAPRTKLFITGYPRFWNDQTDYCDNKSFKFNCLNNYVLPLTKARRAKMNALTQALNDKIQTIIRNYPTSGDIHFVDVDPYFEGHRFCEEGVNEPSYRNSNIWFYPLEYWTGGTVVEFDGKSAPSGDCDAILENDGDAGDYFGCLMANSAIANSTSINLSKLPNNVPGDNELAINSGGGRPDWIARVFHPTINGMGAYQEAIIKAYQEYTPRQTSLQGGIATPTTTKLSHSTQLPKSTTASNLP